MKQVLITGHTGFVGKCLTAYLHSAGYKVSGVGREKGSAAPYLEHEYSWEEFSGGNILPPEAIVHLAGKAHDLRAVKDNGDEYMKVNYELTKSVFTFFLNSPAAVFVFMSSVKASADKVQAPLTETLAAAPQTAYGKSKLFAEEFILSQPLPPGKHVYILRPCMIHGPGNKGNLNLLYQLVRKGIPYPLGAFNNERSFLTVDNLCFALQELLSLLPPSGIYNLADDSPLSTQEVIRLINVSLGKHERIWHIPQGLVRFAAKIGDVLKLPLTTERLNKLTENYVVDNTKISQAIGKSFPYSAREGILKTFKDFKNND